jgi:hypothetical protein
MTQEKHQQMKSTNLESITKVPIRSGRSISRTRTLTVCCVYSDTIKYVLCGLSRCWCDQMSLKVGKNAFMKWFGGLE